MDRQKISSDFPRKQWDYLKEGIMVDTNFCGLVHYLQSDDEELALVERVS